MEILSKHQSQLKSAFGDVQPEKFMPLFEELTRQNMAFFEETMQMAVSANTEPAPKPHDTKESEIADLQNQLAALQDKVNQLS